MTLKPRSDPEVEAWLAKSAGDARMAEAACGIEDPLWDQACFHAHQAAEKALKAFMTAAGTVPSRTHDLVFLVEVIAKLEPDAQRLVEVAAGLAHHAVGPRYPSFLAPETEEEAQDAIRRATKIREWVEEKLSRN
jgi:HEPN domain-containing protein